MTHPMENILLQYMELVFIENGEKHQNAHLIKLLENILWYLGSYNKMYP